jgi:hypothetical protein
MWIIVAFALLGVGLGLRIQSHLGALFLGLCGVTSIHVILDAAPRLLAHLSYGRPVVATVRAVSLGGGASLVNTGAAFGAGLLIAMLLQTMSEDRPGRNWDPDARARRRSDARSRG